MKILLRLLVKHIIQRLIRTHVLATSPEGEPRYCHSPAEFGATYFSVGQNDTQIMDYGPWTERRRN